MHFFSECSARDLALDKRQRFRCPHPVDEIQRISPFDGADSGRLVDEAGRGAEGQRVDVPTIPDLVPERQSHTSIAQTAPEPMSDTANRQLYNCVGVALMVPSICKLPSERNEIENIHAAEHLRYLNEDGET